MIAENYRSIQISSELSNKGFLIGRIVEMALPSVMYIEIEKEEDLFTIIHRRRMLIFVYQSFSDIVLLHNTRLYTFFIYNE